MQKQLLTCEIDNALFLLNNIIMLQSINEGKTFVYAIKNQIRFS